MLSKMVGISVLTAALALGTTAVASAETSPPAPARLAPTLLAQDRWAPVFYFGMRTYCVRAGVMGQQMGVLAEGIWTCDSEVGRTDWPRVSDAGL
jgi:hypothetical protein